MRGNRSGVTSLEFALTLPVFVALLGGIIDSGWLFFEQSALDASAHLGCRVGSTYDSGVNDADIKTVYSKTESAIRNGMKDSLVDCNGCTVTVETLYSIPGRSLRCTIRNSYEPLVGTFPPMDLQSIVIVRMEVQR